MFGKKCIAAQLSLRVPVIQAPMAGGATTVDLVTAVSNCGGLGSIASAYLPLESLRSQIREVTEKLNGKPFAVNTFIPNPVDYDRGDEPFIRKIVSEHRQTLRERKNDLPPIEDSPALPKQEDLQKNYESTLAIILEMKPTVFSFTFGVPEQREIKELADRGIFIIGTATSVEEGIVLQEIGCDAVVAQGYEAGAHRGAFISKEHVNDENAGVGLVALVPAMADALKIPVIAAGGIMDSRGIKACLALGASAVQMGTKFLASKESGIPQVYKESLVSAKNGSTRFTKGFSGRLARGIKNNFMETMTKHEDAILDFPLQHTLTSCLRKEAAEVGEPNFMSLWAGQGVGALKHVRSVAEIMDELA